MRGRRRSRAPLRSGGSGRKPQYSYCHYTSLDLFVNTQHAHGNLKPPTHHPRRLHRTQTPRHLPRTQLPPLHHQPHPIPTHNPPTDLQKEAATSPPTAHTTPRKETKKRGESTSFPPFHGHDLAATPMLTLLQHQVQQHTSHPQHHDRQHADKHHDPLRRNRAALRIQHVIGSLTERTQGQREPSTAPRKPTAPASHQTSHRHIQRGSSIRLNPDGKGDRQVNSGPPTIGNETRQQVHLAEPNHAPYSAPSAPHGA